MSSKPGFRSISAVLPGVLTGTLLAATGLLAETEQAKAKVRPAAAQLTTDIRSDDPNLTIIRGRSATAGDSPATTDRGSAGAHCPPSGGSQRLTRRMVPPTEPIGMPLHHRNFSGDCYGENWRLQNWNFRSCSASFHRRTHNHSLCVERFFGGLCGKLPRGYIHDSSGQPMRGFFVPQGSDPTLAYVPGSDTMESPHLVTDYANFVYSPRNCPECSEHGHESSVSPPLVTPSVAPY